MDLNALPLPALYAHFEATGLVHRLLELARDEDLGYAADGQAFRRGDDALHGGVGDHAPHHAHTAASGYRGDITTAACIPPRRRATALVVAREAGVVSGLACIPALLQLFAPGATVALLARDGDVVAARTPLARLEGPQDELLEVERTLLNLLSRMCGIATRTAAFVAALGPSSKAKLLDTRKTSPGMRVFEKYAVRCGGGHCHRIGLFDAVLIKDNHIAGVATADLPAFVAAAAQRARSLSSRPPAFIECEVDTLEQLQALVTLPKGVLDIVLLDNMGPSPLKEAVALRNMHAPHLLLEASGGVTLGSIRALADTGVDRISTGNITHHAVSLDLGLDLEMDHAS